VHHPPYGEMGARVCISAQSMIRRAAMFVLSALLASPTDTQPRPIPLIPNRGFQTPLGSSFLADPHSILRVVCRELRPLLGSATIYCLLGSAIWVGRLAYRTVR